MNEVTTKLTWRRGVAADEPLLFTLFAANQMAEFLPMGLSKQQLEPLLEMQFRARQVSYSQSHPTAVDTILCLEDGTPVGRHLLERQEKAYRGIDLAILPEYQNRGIGTWALQEIQKLAGMENISFRLRVLRRNPALRLYERLGFMRVSADEVSYEMEWQGGETAKSSITLPDSAAVLLNDCSRVAKQEITERIIRFLREIKLTVHLGAVPSSSFLPGVQMVSNGLRVDIETLRFPGDLLHEAGHLAVMAPEQRAAGFPSSQDAAEEMGALAWSYAAATHIGLPPEVVFHDDGYRGHARNLVHSFTQGSPVGLPFLWWIGLTTQPHADQPSMYPKMLRWLRAEAPVAEQAVNTGNLTPKSKNGCELIGAEA